MLFPTGGGGMNSTMDDMNLIHQAQRHHLVVREIGEEIDLEIGPGDDDPSFSNNTLINVPPQESAAEDHDESKQMMMHQASGGNQNLLKTQPAKKKKKVVKRWREEWADTYKWAYVDVKDGTARIFCSVCREYGRKHRRNPYGNEGSRNMQMSALEEHNNSLLHKEALRLQMASKDKIVVDKPLYVKALMSKTAGSIIEAALKRDPHELEFIQSVQEVIHALERVISKNSSYVSTMERLLEPERTIIFRVPWVDDRGETHVNRGFRVHFNQTLGPCRGGLRFHPSMNLSIAKFLSFGQTLKNALSPYRLGGSSGGSDFDPKSKSDGEVMRFCQSFMNELYRYLGPEKDLPSEEMGVGTREMGFLHGQYRRLAGHSQIVPSPYKGKGKRGGRPYRGSAHGHLGGGQLQPSYALPTYAENQPKVFQGASQIHGGPSQVKPSSSASGNSAPVRPPPRMAWCELCRIECNTPEVLEQHKNGKKHKKNLKAYEERQKLNKQMDGAHGHQTTNSEVKPKVSYQPAVEGSGQLPLGHLPSETVTGDRQLLPQEKLLPHAVKEEDGSMTGKEKVEETAPVDHVQGQGHGVKRNMKGGRGGKLMKTQNGSRKPAVPPKPQKMVPLICELCNVKCESVVVFQSHLAGRKHLSNVKDFQGQQAMVGQAALQALYPALQALYPALQALCQPNTGASTSGPPQVHQHNLHEILGILTQQVLSAIPQDQLVGLGAAATSAIPQDQLVGIGAAAASAFPPPSNLLPQAHQGSKLQGSASEETRENAAAEDGRNCDLSVLQNTGSKPEENTDNKRENVNLEVERKVMTAEEPLRFAPCGDVPSTSGAVSATVSVSNSEVVSSDSAAHSVLDGKLAD